MYLFEIVSFFGYVNFLVSIGEIERVRSLNEEENFGRILTWLRSFALSHVSFFQSSLDRLVRSMNDLIRSPDESWAGGPSTLWYALGKGGAVTFSISLPIPLLILSFLLLFLLHKHSILILFCFFKIQ